MNALRGGLWVWVGILIAFLILATIIGNGRSAWAITQYAVLSVMGLIFLLALVSGFYEMWERRRNGKRDD